MQKSTIVCLINVNTIAEAYQDTFVVDDFSQKIYFVRRENTQPGLSLISIDAHKNLIHKYVNFEDFERPGNIRMSGDNNGTLYTSYINVAAKKVYL
jgi:hypothetical protein